MNVEKIYSRTGPSKTVEQLHAANVKTVNLRQQTDL